MHGNWRHYGYHGQHWGHHGWHHRHYRRGGMMWIVPMILLFLLVFGVFKFFWPLLLIGFIILMAKAVCPLKQWQRRDWNEKLKNEEKPKRDDPRYVQTEDGEWLEII
ncbi:MAG: hypothetical protein HZC41_26690 [Chloroflexi bacterium]|nr:hypothetical protein [Chloroflexota bacterium]